MKTSPFLTGAIVLLLVLSAGNAQSQPRGKGRKPGMDPAGGEAVWVLPPVEGPNLHYRKFHSSALGGEVSYMIYLPEEYEKSTEARYPVVYWLHGKGAGQQGLPGFAQSFNEAIAARKCPPLIVVYPNGLPLGGYTDSPDGKRPVESMIIKELIPHIDAKFRTRAAREGRMIEGFSMGGSGAAKFGFKYPELFGSISILAGALHTAESLGGASAGMFEATYGGKDRFAAESDPWQLAERNAGKVRGRSAVRMAVGGRDPLRKKNEAFHDLLDRLEIAHDFTEVGDAPHAVGTLYRGLGDNNWEFYRRAFAAPATGNR
jgi:enterochelin esterase-like enzyme